MNETQKKPMRPLGSHAADEKKLIKRYLIWLYKVTQEELDRTDRKFTQLKVDHYLLNQLSRYQHWVKKSDQKDYSKGINDLKVYIKNKEEEAYRLKFSNSKNDSLSADYLFLKIKLSFIEKAIQSFLGKRALEEIKSLYQATMINRILEAHEHT